MRINSVLTPALTLAAALLCLSACKEKDDTVVINPVPEPTARDYVPAYPGSYWIYESYYVDSNGNGSPGNFGGGPSVIDSCYMAADTTFGGNTYRCLMKPIYAGATDYEATYYRDSARYLVTPAGKIIFAPFDTGRVYQRAKIDNPGFSADSTVQVNYYSGDGRTVSAQGRNFPTIAAVTDWTFIPFAKDNKPVSHRRLYTRYAMTVGIVRETMPIYASDPGYVERRLVRSRVIFPIQ